MLYLKHVAVQSFGENVVFVHKNCELYKVDDKYFSLYPNYLDIFFNDTGFLKFDDR